MSSTVGPITSDCQLYQPICQKCFNPLQLHQDFEHLQKAELMTLIDATNSVGESNDPMNLVPVRNSSTPYPRYLVPPNPHFSTPFDENDAINVLQSYSGPTSSLDHRLRVNACLFDMLSGRTEVDHPLCKDCADSLLGAKQQCIEFQEEELKCLQYYLNYLDSKSAKFEYKLKCKQQQEAKNVNNLQPYVTTTDANVNASTNVDDISLMLNDTALSDSNDKCNESVRDDGDDDDDDDDDDDNIDFDGFDCDLEGVDRTNAKETNSSKLNELEQTLNELQTNLNELLEESAQLDKEIIDGTTELEKRKEELDRATTQYNDQKLALLDSEEEMLCLEARLNYAKSHLKRLQRTNVLNIAFPIWYDGHIGIINGLHLGRLPNRPVNWEEINAAWGQCALLLQCIAKKINYVFQNFRIVPMGSQSKVIQLSGQKEFPLYYTTGRMRLLSADKFDTAMINFLDCLNQIQQIIEHMSNIQLPHRIKDRGKLEDPDGQLFSVRWNGNTEENWTKALKMMLINMKWIIATLTIRTNHKPDDKRSQKDNYGIPLTIQPDTTTTANHNKPN